MLCGGGGGGGGGDRPTCLLVITPCRGAGMLRSITKCGKAARTSRLLLQLPTYEAVHRRLRQNPLHSIVAGQI